jgi:hypothetical protein
MNAGTMNRTGNGILKELLRTPVYKDLLRTNLKGMRTQTGSSLVKTVMGQDPEVFLGLVSSLPVFLNNLSSAAAELASQLSEKFPPELLMSYLEALFEDIDTEKCRAACTELFASLWGASPDLRDRARKAILASGPKVIAEGINFLARAVNNTTRQDPKVLSSFISGVLGGLDHAEIRKATQGLAEAFLDQKWNLASWAWELAKSRMRKRFHKIGIGTSRQALD